MMKTSDLRTMCEVIEKYGHQTQSMVAMEELAELSVEVSKAVRGADNRTSLIEEIADAKIMITQLELMNVIESDEVDEAISRKMARPRDRLEAE